MNSCFNHAFTDFVLKSTLHIQNTFISRNYEYFVRKENMIIFRYFLILFFYNIPASTLKRRNRTFLLIRKLLNAPFSYLLLDTDM
jgi:hypothetical protein